MTFKELLTSPLEHDPNNFVYLVHGFINHGSEGITPEEMKRKAMKVINNNRFYSASLISCLESGQAMGKLGYNDRVFLVGTFGNFGLILNPPSDKAVYIAWNSDIGSPREQKELKNFAVEHRGKIKSPLELLTINGIYSYNELIIKGHEKTSIDGVFYRDNLRGEPFGKLLCEVVSSIVKKDIPLVQLPKELKIPADWHWDSRTDEFYSEPITRKFLRKIKWQYHSVL